MGFSMIIRTGNLKQNENLWMVYLAQIVNGSAFSILTTTTFPEIVDSVENRPDYYQYDKESMNLHISGMFVFISAIAQLLGVFLGSSFAGTWGYNTAFIIIGMTLIAFGCLYGLICGVNEGFDRIRNEIIGRGSDPSAGLNARHSKSMECHSERLRDSDS